jgi:hypothetical protein
VRETLGMLENVGHISPDCSINRIPIYGEVQIEIEVRDYRLSVDLHVSRRRKVSLLYVLDLTNECLLRSASGTGIPIDGALIHHDGKGKSGMCFHFRHHQLGNIILKVTGAVPVHDHAINAAADHVLNLSAHLRGIL